MSNAEYDNEARGGYDGETILTRVSSSMEAHVSFDTEDAMFEPPARRLTPVFSPTPAATPGIIEQPPTPAQRPPPTVSRPD